MSGTPKKTSSSPYQVLGNRPIDQWKVTELKEELKRRKLITRGLKDDLVKRLDEALHIERDNIAAVAEAGLNGVTDAHVQDTSDNVATPEQDVGGKYVEIPQEVEESKVDKTDVDWVKVNDVDCQTVTGEQNEEAADDSSDGRGPVSGKAEVVMVQKTVVETITETVVSETHISTQEIDNENVKSEAQNYKPKSQLENESTKSEIDTEDCEGSKSQKDSEKPVQADSTGSSPKVLGSVGQDSSIVKTIETQDQVPASGREGAPIPTNQVSEVSPSLGLEVKSGSISSDSVSIVEKNELKDNIIADNVKFELNVKPEMVQPSSVNVAPDAGGSHPMDEDPLEKKLSADDKDGNATFVDRTNADMEYPEKLNLDRSSGDDSMDEDVFDNKQMDTKTMSNVYEDKNEHVEVEIKDEIIVDVVSEGKEDSHVEDKGVVAAEKRKFPGQQSTGNNEPVKRQRRWNTESAKAPEPQITAAALSTTPKEHISPAVGRPVFLRSDSTNSEDTTKERVVPPSANPPTNSLRIDRFLRPFTLKAVQELLGKTGKVISFWMDHIKTHCYVTYSSVEEAIETRNAVYNLQWPTNGGRLLAADFVDPQEVKNRVEVPTPSPAAPISTPAPPQAAAPAKQPQSSPRQVQRQQSPLQASFPPPPQLSVPPPAMALPPPLPEKVEAPIVTLDDLFRRTTTLPRIYYLPLSEEHVAEKLAARGKNVKI